MDRLAFEAKVQDLKARAYGRWTEILTSQGIDPKVLNKRNQACPMCGGTDRFQYTDKFGEGNYFCRGCGPGGGLKLLEGALGLDFATILKRLEDCVGATPVASRPQAGASSGVPSAQSMKRLAKRIWDEAKPVVAGDEVDRYLRSRGLGLEHYPKVLRCHPALGYYEKVGDKNKKLGACPAMLACIQGPDGHAVTLHRTYLRDGKKAFGSQSKKVLSSGIVGAAVRLAEPTQELAVAEGIETALAVYLATGKPVWAALSAGNLERLWVPPCVERVCIYGDNDAGAQFDGQAAAYGLARRLCKEACKQTPKQSNKDMRMQPTETGATDAGRTPCRRLHVEVFVPKQAGTDWADVRVQRLVKEQQAA
jgi:putative DNA primase/helicase